MLELEKNEKSKIRGGGVICAPSAVYGRVPLFQIQAENMEIEIMFNELP